MDARRSSAGACPRGWSWTIAALAVLGTAGTAEAQWTRRGSEDSAGVEGNGQSWYAWISGDGKRLAYASSSSNLVLNDTNGAYDGFVKDFTTVVTTRINVDSAGAQANSAVEFISAAIPLSGDGRWVAFSALASNLVAGDTNNRRDVFLHDMQTGATTRVSLDSAGAQVNGNSYVRSMSPDARYVAFESDATNLVTGDTNNIADVFLRDVVTGTTTRVSVSSAGVQGNGVSRWPVVSGDGRYVAFSSASNNLVTGDTNLAIDIFVRDVQAGTTTRVSVDSAGTAANAQSLEPSISLDGRFVAFHSDATNLVAGDTNAVQDVFVHDRLSGITRRASVDSNGVQGNASASSASLSGDGHWVAFHSAASNLVPNDTNGTPDIFAFDMVRLLTERISLTSTGGEAGNQSVYPALSPDGRFFAFHSFASNLVPNDNNGLVDTFGRDRGTTAYCLPKLNGLACLPAIAFAGIPSVTAGGGFTVTGSNVLNQKWGYLWYSTTGASASSFQGGTLCISAPYKKCPVQTSGGTMPPVSDCTGAFSRDFNAFIAGGTDPALVAGQNVWCQFYSRDPNFVPPGNTNLTDALQFTIGP